jgi:hypothetical protein
MLTDMQKKVRLALLRTEETRFTDIIDASQDVEAALLSEGRHADAQHQREGTTLEAKRELERVQTEIRALDGEA